MSEENVEMEGAETVEAPAPNADTPEIPGSPKNANTETDNSDKVITASTEGVPPKDPESITPQQESEDTPARSPVGVPAEEPEKVPPQDPEIVSSQAAENAPPQAVENAPPQDAENAPPQDAENAPPQDAVNTPPQDSADSTTEKTDETGTQTVETIETPQNEVVANESDKGPPEEAADSATTENSEIIASSATQDIETPSVTVGTATTDTCEAVIEIEDDAEVTAAAQLAYEKHLFERVDMTVIDDTDDQEASKKSDKSDKAPAESEKMDVDTNTGENLEATSKEGEAADSAKTDDKATQAEATPVAEEGKKKQISIFVHSLQHKKEFQLDERVSIKEVREMVAEKFEISIERIILIFSGKEVKDEDTLEQHKIGDGSIVHLVIKSKAFVEPNLEQFFNFRGLVGLNSLGIGPSSLIEIQNKLQRDLENNPALVQQFIANPFTQTMLSNPAHMRNYITNHPHMKGLLKRNPEIERMLNDPEVLEQSLELVQDPEALEEVIKKYKTTMPTYNVLDRLYREMQEPVLASLNEQFSNHRSGSGPSGSGNRQDKDKVQGEQTEKKCQETENDKNKENAEDKDKDQPMDQDASDVQASKNNVQGNQDQSQQNKSPSNVALIQQMADNAEMVQTMLSSPYTQAIMKSVISNPKLADSLIRDNPLFATNPSLQEEVGKMLPAFMQQLQDPAMQKVLTNPQALNAIMQVQQGIDILRQNAPNSINFAQYLVPPPAEEPELEKLESSEKPESEKPEFETPESEKPESEKPESEKPDSEEPETDEPPPKRQKTDSQDSRATVPEPTANTFQNSFSQFMAKIVSEAAGDVTESITPEEKYDRQLKQLVSMGFPDTDANLEALITTSGNVREAAEKLLTVC